LKCSLKDPKYCSKLKLKPSYWHLCLSAILLLRSFIHGLEPLATKEPEGSVNSQKQVPLRHLSGSSGFTPDLKRINFSCFHVSSLRTSRWREEMLDSHRREQCIRRGIRRRAASLKQGLGVEPWKFVCGASQSPLLVSGLARLRGSEWGLIRTSGGPICAESGIPPSRALRC